MARRRRIRPRQILIIIGLSVLLLWLLWLFWGILQKEERARHAATESRQELESLRERKDTLEANIEELNTSRGEEAALREAYGVARPGEEVIIVVADDGPAGPPLPWWRKVLGFFGL